MTNCCFVRGLIFEFACHEKEHSRSGFRPFVFFWEKIEIIKTICMYKEYELIKNTCACAGEGSGYGKC